MPAKSVTEIMEIFFDRGKRYNVRSSHGNVYIEGDVLFSYDWQHAIAVDLRSSAAELYIIAGGRESDYRGTTWRHVTMAQEYAHIGGLQIIVAATPLEGFGSFRTSDHEMMKFAMDGLEAKARSLHENSVRLHDEARKLETDRAYTMAALKLAAARFKMPHQEAKVWRVKPDSKSA